MNTYTLTTTRKQFVLVWHESGEKQIRHYRRNDKGATSCDRKIGHLIARGYTEKKPEPTFWQEMRELV